MIKYDSSNHDFRSDYRNLRGLVDMILTLPVAWRGTPMIEIGSNTGDSAQVFSMFFSPVVCIDIFQKDRKGRDGLWVMDSFLKKTKDRGVRHFRGDSNEAVKAKEFDLPKEIWFAYIDGSHYEPYVSQDILNIWPRIKEGGIIAGHDYGSIKNEALVGVTTAVNKFFGEPDKVFIDGSWLVQKTANRIKL